jgi:peroxiredoxin
VAAPSTLAQESGKQPKHSEKEHKHSEKEHKQEGTKAAAKIGEPAPAFSLTDTEGKTHALADLKGKVVVLEWFNPGCPVVQMHHKAHTMTDTAKKFEGKEVVWLAINSGAPGMQGHGKETNSKARKDWTLGYPVLLDEAGTVGRSYGAKTTPHMFVIDKTGTLVYAGAIDNGSGNKVGDVNYVENAVTAALAGETVDTAETKPYGCGVKYGRNKQ